MLILSICLITICVLLMGVILLQNRGAGLSLTFGGGGGVYSTRRGAEKIFFYATIILGIVFVLLSFSFTFISPAVPSFPSQNTLPGSTKPFKVDPSKVRVETETVNGSNIPSVQIDPSSMRIQTKKVDKSKAKGSF